MEQKESKFQKIIEIFNNRELVLSIIVVIVSVVFILQLFNLQIINGSTYREQAENKIVRTETISASRGEIYDRNGVILATNKLSYNVEIFRTKIGVAPSNKAIIDFVNILEENGEDIYSTFPLNESKDEMNFENDEERLNWLRANKLKDDTTFEGILEHYSKLYGANDYNLEDRLKIIRVKYEANLGGYSLFNSSIVAKNISPKVVAQIEEMKSTLYGINIVSVPQRYYISDTFACHLLGYVSKINTSEYRRLQGEGYTINSVIGKTGVEESMEKYLKGADGKKKVITDSLGNVTSETIVKEATSGNNLTLTIDYRIQNVVEKALKTTLYNLQMGITSKNPVPEAQAGSCVVLDVESGEILAIASYPEYNINSFINGISSKDWNLLMNNAQKPMFNRAISGVYSPGSTYKMLVGLAGLESGGITVNETYTDPGIYPHSYNPKCWLYTSHGVTHGTINLSGALKGSCNCFFYEVGRRIGIDSIVKWSANFGLGSKTGIELSGEETGTIAGNGESGWSLGDTLAASIGQSKNLYTPVQLANYISTIANGGKLNKVTTIKEVGNNENSVPLTDVAEHTKLFTGVDFEEKNIDLPNEYINAIKIGMYAVTTETGGTASDIFRDSKVEVAGKTGTAQVSNGANNAIFVGFAPYNNPKIAVVAIVEHGSEGYYLANMVKEITNEYFNIYTSDAMKEKTQEIVKNKLEF